MSGDTQEGVHLVMCELGCLSEILKGLAPCYEPPPLEWIQGWVERLHSDLDRLLCSTAKEAVS